MRASFSRFTVLSVLVGLQFWGSVGNPALAQQAIPPAAPVGEVKGSELAHTAASAQRLMADAALALPAAQAGGAVFFGKLAAAPAVSPVPGNLPVVVFLHGSSGLGLLRASHPIRLRCPTASPTSRPWMWTPTSAFTRCACLR
jgi:hypothetical protein